MNFCILYTLFRGYIHIQNFGNYKVDLEGDGDTGPALPEHPRRDQTEAGSMACHCAYQSCEGACCHLPCAGFGARREKRGIR